MRKVFAVGTALMMILMAFAVLAPNAVADLPPDSPSDPDPVPSVKIFAYPPSVNIGDYWRLRIETYNPFGYDLTVKFILPPAFAVEWEGDYRTGDFQYTIGPGGLLREFFMLSVSMGAESHWETVTAEVWDTGTMLSYTEVDIWIMQYDGFLKDAILLGDSIELNQEIHWLFGITVANTEAWEWGSMYNCVVTDSFAAGYEIHDSDLGTPEFDPYYITPGTTFEYTTNGITEITWTIGELAPGEQAELIFELSHDGFSAPGRYQLNSGATLTFDRDGPCEYIVPHMAQTAEIVINAPGNWDIRTIGFWKHQFNCALGLKKKANQHVPTESLLAYLAEISASSTVPELQAADTLEEALAILTTKNNADMYDRTVTQLLATWLNYVSGNNMWDSDGDDVDDTLIMDTILWAEAGLLDGDPTNDEMIKDTLDMLNNSGEE